MLARLGRALGFLVVFALPAVPSAAAEAELRLVMVEQPGCSYCLRWHDEIGPIYPKTPEGAAAPLERVLLQAPLPEGIDFEAPAVFTPTFVLVRNGTEIGRIEGYPGEDFFWGLLGRMLESAGNKVTP